MVHPCTGRPWLQCRNPAAPATPVLLASSCCGTEVMGRSTAHKGWGHMSHMSISTTTVCLLMFLQVGGTCMCAVLAMQGLPHCSGKSNSHKQCSVLATADATTLFPALSTSKAVKLPCDMTKVGMLLWCTHAKIMDSRVLGQ